jgi:hypothetical protein
MNELEFKKHLKDLVQGHHHPEEHDWNQQIVRSAKTRAGGNARAKKNSRPRRSKRK